jgi:Flp pilus assembly protein CpaB
MIAPTAPETTGRAVAKAARRARPTPRIAVAVVLGLLAFVVFLAATADRGKKTAVAVAAQPIPVGAVITEAMVSPVEVDSDSTLADSLVPMVDIADGGVVANRTILAGEPVSRTAIGEGGGAPSQRVMSIPVPIENAAGGDISVGDQVDVIDTVDGLSRYVLVGADVVGRAENSDRLGASGTFWVSVTVDEAEAIAVADALSDGKVLVLRSTGVTPAPSAPEQAPADPASSVPPPDTSAGGG